eukprot:2078941-Prymnesium_polylepis.1
MQCTACRTCTPSPGTPIYSFDWQEPAMIKVGCFALSCCCPIVPRCCNASVCEAVSGRSHVTLAYSGLS